MVDATNPPDFGPPAEEFCATGRVEIEHFPIVGRDAGTATNVRSASNGTTTMVVWLERYFLGAMHAKYTFVNDGALAFEPKTLHSSLHSGASAFPLWNQSEGRFEILLSVESNSGEVSSERVLLDETTGSVVDRAELPNVARIHDVAIARNGVLGLTFNTEDSSFAFAIDSQGDQRIERLGSRDAQVEAGFDSLAFLGAQGADQSYVWFVDGAGFGAITPANQFEISGTAATPFALVRVGGRPALVFEEGPTLAQFSASGAISEPRTIPVRPGDILFDNGDGLMVLDETLVTEFPSDGPAPNPWSLAVAIQPVDGEPIRSLEFFDERRTLFGPGLRQVTINRITETAEVVDIPLPEIPAMEPDLWYFRAIFDMSALERAWTPSTGEFRAVLVQWNSVEELRFDVETRGLQRREWQAHHTLNRGDASCKIAYIPESGPAPCIRLITPAANCSLESDDSNLEVYWLEPGEAPTTPDETYSIPAQDRGGRCIIPQRLYTFVPFPGGLWASIGYYDEIVTYRVTDSGTSAVSSRSFGALYGSDSGDAFFRSLSTHVMPTETFTMLIGSSGFTEFERPEHTVQAQPKPVSYFGGAFHYVSSGPSNAAGNRFRSVISVDETASGSTELYPLGEYQKYLGSSTERWLTTPDCGVHPVQVGSVGPPVPLAFAREGCFVHDFAQVGDDRWWLVQPLDGLIAVRIRCVE